jgi:NAD(P)-dependent dehydrogenase (short-subunit alcohol dehydrogenase family)
MPATSVDSFRLDGKTALVTGAGRGIGRAVALALASAGAELILVSRTRSQLDEVAGEIAKGGGKAQALPFDVTDTGAMRDAFAGIPRLDILVNNAGLNRPQPFLDVDEVTLDLLLELNVRAAFLVAQAAARFMVAQGAGVIVNMSSQMGHVGSERDRTVYVMTKHALEGLTKAMAVELAPKGVRVVSIAPTFVQTPLTKPFFDDPETRK